MKAAPLKLTISAERLIRAADERESRVARMVLKLELPQAVRDLEGRITLRLDRIADGVLMAARSEKDYVAVLEQHIRELQTQLRELEKKVEGR